MNCKLKEYPACNDFFKNCPSAEYVEVGKDKVCKFMQARFVCEIADPKRKPLSDGTLPLTDEELKELSEIIGKRAELVEIVNDAIFISYFVESAGEYGGEETSSIKAIIYLAERFDTDRKIKLDKPKRLG
jgi:hypothetical protein